MRSGLLRLRLILILNHPARVKFKSQVRIEFAKSSNRLNVDNPQKEERAPPHNKPLVLCVSFFVSSV